MARTDAANAANTTYGGQSKQAFNSAQTDIGQFEGNVGKLSAGVDVGANPFQSTAYLSNVNKLQSESLNNAAGSAKSEIARRERATGGLNGSQATMAQRDVGLQTGRLADTLSAERAAGDFGKNLSWQQYLTGAPLQAAGVEGSLYGTATGGQGNALNNLSSLYNSETGAWAGLGAAGLNALGQIGAAKINNCWIAAELFGGWNEPRTVIVRSWLNDEFKQHWIGRAVMKMYERFGERIAESIHKFKPLGWLFRPLFELALWKTCRDRTMAVSDELGVI